MFKVNNLKLVRQASWRVVIVHFVAKLVGLLVHVEGLPYGSSRNYRHLRDWESPTRMNEEMRAAMGQAFGGNART